MPDRPLPPRPILVLPEEVSAELVLAGLAASTPDPTAESAAGDRWPGVARVTGIVGAALTVIGPAGPAIRSAARRLHRWNNDHPLTSAPEADSVRRLLMYRTDRGSTTLDLGERPTAAQLEEWLTAAYAVLEEELRPRQEDQPPEHNARDEGPAESGPSPTRDRHPPSGPR